MQGLDKAEGLDLEATWRMPALSFKLLHYNKYSLQHARHVAVLWPQTMTMAETSQSRRWLEGAYALAGDVHAKDSCGSFLGQLSGWE